MHYCQTLFVVNLTSVEWLIKPVSDGSLPKGAVYMLGLMSYDEVRNKKNQSSISAGDSSKQSSSSSSSGVEQQKVVSDPDIAQLFKGLRQLAYHVLSSQVPFRVACQNKVSGTNISTTL